MSPARIPATTKATYPATVSAKRTVLDRQRTSTCRPVSDGQTFSGSRRQQASAIPAPSASVRPSARNTSVACVVMDLALRQSLKKVSCSANATDAIEIGTMIRVIHTGDCHQMPDSGGALRNFMRPLPEVATHGPGAGPRPAPQHGRARPEPPATTRAPSRTACGGSARRGGRGR